MRTAFIFDLYLINYILIENFFFLRWILKTAIKSKAKYIKRKKSKYKKIKLNKYINYLAKKKKKFSNNIFTY